MGDNLRIKDHRTDRRPSASIAAVIIGTVSVHDTIMNVAKNVSADYTKSVYVNLKKYRQNNTC